MDKKNKLKKPTTFKILPIKKQEQFYRPPKQLIEPFDELINKGGGNLICIGPPGSGKSIYINNLILSDNAFKDCFNGAMYCISPTIYDDLSSCYLRDEMDFIETDYSEALMKGIYDNIMSIPTKDRGLSLCLFDDCLDNFKSHRDYISKVTAVVRHMKTICMFSLQRLKGIPSGLRANTTISVIFYIPSHKEFKQIQEFHSFFGGEKNFLEHYTNATNTRYGCLICDFRNLRMYKHGGNTNRPELLWAKYNSDGTEWTPSKETDELNKGAIKDE
tara:strand:- start:2154 stop:2975 length:822 start_codon:yes stop_codon:yes gene_type:complete